MFKKKQNPVVVTEEKPPSFEFDFEVINKQIDQVRRSLTEISRDGKYSPLEFSRLLKELQILESLLISFLDKEFIKSITASNRFFKEKLAIIAQGSQFEGEDIITYGFKPNVQMAEYNKQICYEKHIMEYLGALVRVANKAAFKIGNA